MFLFHTAASNVLAGAPLAANPLAGTPLQPSPQGLMGMTMSSITYETVASSIANDRAVRMWKIQAIKVSIFDFHCFAFFGHFRFRQLILSLHFLLIICCCFILAVLCPCLGSHWLTFMRTVVVKEQGFLTGVVRGSAIMHRLVVSFWEPLWSEKGQHQSCNSCKF